MMINTNKFFSHLSEKEIRDIYNRYINNDKVSNIINDYNLDISSFRLIQYIPLISSEEFICPYCNIPMFIRLRRKSFKDKYYYLCKNCEHTFIKKSEEIFCSCLHCENIKIEQEKVRKKEFKHNIMNSHYTHTMPIQYSSLTLVEKCTLYALELYRLEYDVNYFFSLSDLESIVIPKHFLIDRIIEETLHLYNKNILIISPETSYSAFQSKDNLKIINPDLLRFDINIVNDDGLILSFNELFSLLNNELKNYSFNSEQLNELQSFILELQIEDAINFLNDRINKFVGYPFVTNNGKFKEVIADCLHHFPMSRLRYFIQKAVKDAIVFYESRGASSKKHAINTIPGSINSLTKRAIENNWDIYVYTRGTGFRTQLNFVLFDIVLKKWDESLDMGFYKSYDEIVNYIK